MKSIFLTLWKWIKNPFFTSTVLFVTWMLFFDSNSYTNIKKQVNRLEQIEQEQEFSRQGIAHYKEELQAIGEDPEQLEKFARENSFFKEKGEDIFVLEEEEEE